MATCNVYKNGKLLGTGAITNTATTITSWTPNSAAALAPDGANFVGRNVQVVMTSSTDADKQFSCRITADNGSGTLTVAGIGGVGNPWAT